MRHTTAFALTVTLTVLLAAMALAVAQDGTGTAKTEKNQASSAYHKTLVKSGYAPVNGLQMYYEIHGTGTARPLITIHPWLGLANVFPSLSRNRQLIAVELQGHGRTADIDRPITFEQHAEDVVALMKHLGIRQADFFGESFGGTVSVLIALRHPELVRRVVTYASHLGTFEPDPKSVADFMSLTHDHRSVQFPREAYEKVAPDPSYWPAFFAKAHRITWKGLSQDELKSVKVPVLIVTGDHDLVPRSVEHRLAEYRLIPNPQLAVIPNAGHFVLSEDPETVLPIVANFLDQPTPTVPFATAISGYHPGETR
jgi:pimeloyl-ACP methyl ester carboxylesterase